MFMMPAFKLGATPIQGMHGETTGSVLPVASSTVSRVWELADLSVVSVSHTSLRSRAFR
jgi:hypothetical protein